MGSKKVNPAMPDLNAKYLQQLLDDQMALLAMLETRRHALDDIAALEGDGFEGKRLGPSIRMMDQSYMMILEDALKVVNSLTEYFRPKPKAELEMNSQMEPRIL